MSEQMATINEVGVGMRDAGKPILWFTVSILDGGAALNVFDWQEAAEIIRDYGVYEVHSLNGRPCCVEVEGYDTIRYKRAVVH